MVQVLRYGYRVPFRSRPPLSCVPIPLPSYSPNSIRGLALSDAVSALVEKEAIEIAPPSPGFYSRLFVTPKVTWGWRPVIDLSHLNGWVELSSFHMETAQSVLRSLRPGDWMVSLDLQDAYLQVPVHPASCRYLRLCVGDTAYQFRALCFGLSSAPQVFTHVMAPISSIMHRHGFRLLRYLDDWLVLGSTFQELVRARDFLLWLCRLLGVIVNPSKSSLVPTQDSGLSQDDARDFSFEGFPDPQTGSEVLSPSAGLLIRPPSSCVGLEESSGDDVIHVSHCSRFSSPHEVSPASPQCSRSSPARRDLVSLDDGCLRDLRWWSDDSHLLISLPLGKDHPDLFLFSDASDQGWGAALGDLHLSGLWSPLCSRFSINQRELLAILYVIQGFLPHLRGRSVAVHSDNSTALACLRKQGGTRSSSLNAVAQELLRLCEAQSVRLLPQFIPGHLNVLADSLSRCSQVLSSEWTLCPQAVSELLHWWPATIDLFATSLNHRLPVYFSPMYDPQSAGTDAMLQSWDGLQAYAFPPFSLLPRVLAKVRVSGGLELTLVAPFWPQHHWFPDLLELLLEIPLFLPRRRDLLRQPHLHHFHQNLSVLQLTAYRISGNLRVRPASLTRWLVSLLAADAAPTASTAKPSG